MWSVPRVVDLYLCSVVTFWFLYAKMEIWQKIFHPQKNNDKNMTQCWTPFQNPSMYFHLFCKEALRLRELSPHSTTPVHRSHVYNIGSGPKGGRTIYLFMVRRAGDKVNFSPTVSFVQFMHFTLSSTEWSHEILKTDVRVVINKPTSKRTLIQICIDTKFS